MPRGVYERKVKPHMSKHIDATSDAIEGAEREFSVSEIAVNGPPPIEVAPVDVMRNTGVLDREKFMAEVLRVFLHEPQTDDEPRFCFVGVNGHQMWLERGREYQMRRFHVAVLAQAKSGRVRQRRNIAPDGSQSYVNTEMLTLSFPFTVLEDPNPRGPAWLRETLKQAA